MPNDCVRTLARIALLIAFIPLAVAAQDESDRRPDKDEQPAPPSGRQAKSPPENKAKAETRPGKKRKKKRDEDREKHLSKRPIAPPDYARWEQVDTGQRKFSHDGKWLIYGIKKVDEHRTLHLHRVKGLRATEEATFKQGERPLFSNDSQWLSVTIGKTPAEVKKAKESKTPAAPGATMHLRRLVDGKTTEFENVGGVHFSDDSRFAAIEVMSKSPPRPSGPPKPESPPSGGSAGASKALLVRNLTEGTDTTFGNVVKFAWSDTGALLAMVVDSPSISNSLQLFDPASGTLRTLASSDEEFTSLSWRKDSYDLAAMREMKHKEKEDVSHVLLAWRGLDQPEAEHFSYDHAVQAAFPRERYIAPGLQWSKDGAALFCGLKEWEKKPADFPSPPEKKNKKKNKKNKKNQDKEGAKKKGSEENREPEASGAQESPKNEDPATEKEAGRKKPDGKTLRTTLETPSNVEVWHSKDVDIMPRQKKEADAKKNPARRAAWWPGKGKLVPLETDLTEEVTILGNGHRAIGFDATPHERTAMFGPRLQDVYLIDTLTGKRERILEGVKFTLSPSPDGRYLLFLREGHVWSHDLKNGKQRNLTGALDAHFTDREDDTLAVEKRPFGTGTWFKDSSAVVLYDRYDLWLLAPDGSQTQRLTNGAENEIRHRLSQVNFREENDGHLDPGQVLYLGLYGERTKKSGYARFTLAQHDGHPAQPEQLLWDAKMILHLDRAKEAEVFTYTMERNDLPRDLHLAGADLAQARQVTRTNAFQKDYLWGHSELIDYENKHGVKLQGSLIYPAGYQKGRKYPMIVYIYEKRSQELHRYYTPSEKHPYNPCVFSAEGYFVFQPDIVYRPQEPGISAVECVVPAVEKVLASGMVDPRRVGLMGHSWGAYQTSFIVTQCDLFAAGVAGAPLTDLLSMSVSVYWNSGGTNARIFAQSQGRMDKPFWRDPDTYIRNSPIHGLDSLHTPLLIAFGDKDGAVDWDQGIEMYNAARWAGKEDVVLLVYPGENHGLRQEENMVDYHYRVKEWMAHYVKGENAPKWIVEGKSFLEREKEKEALKEKKDSPKKPAPTDKQSKDSPEKSSGEKRSAKTPEPTGKTEKQEAAKPTPAAKERKRRGKRQQRKPGDAE